MKYQAYEKGRRAYLQAWERLIQRREQEKNQRITIELTAAEIAHMIGALRMQADTDAANGFEDEVNKSFKLIEKLRRVA
jgi:hypothetical protein